MARLEKGFKKAWENLEIIGDNLPNKDVIQPEGKVWDKQKQIKITYLQYFCMKTLLEDRFNNIKAAIINSGKGIDLNLMDESRKRTYKEIIGRDNNVKIDLDNNVIGKSIYIFSLIRYTKIKTYKRYIYIRQ